MKGKKKRNQKLKDKIDKWINSKENKDGVEKLKKQNKEYNEKYQY